MGKLNKPIGFGAAVHGRGDAKISRSPAVGGRAALGGRPVNSAGDTKFEIEDRSTMESANFPKRGASPFDWRP
jgi:hypothetical protein